MSQRSNLPRQILFFFVRKVETKPADMPETISINSNISRILYSCVKRPNCVGRWFRNPNWERINKLFMFLKTLFWSFQCLSRTSVIWRYVVAQIICVPLLCTMGTLAISKMLNRSSTEVGQVICETRSHNITNLFSCPICIWYVTTPTVPGCLNIKVTSASVTG